MSRLLSFDVETRLVALIFMASKKAQSKTGAAKAGVQKKPAKKSQTKPKKTPAKSPKKAQESEPQDLGPEANPSGIVIEAWCFPLFPSVSH